ncbi:MAG TPA: response regulator [Terriglobales bacterium]|nr:response regulator [Terriglobales bacterium]
MSAQITLLCIDDEENGLKLRKLLFEREGHRVLIAPDGPSGIDIFTSQSIDAVIVDYRMPNMDGAVVAERLKELRPAVPVIMLSGENEVPNEAKQTVDAFVTKGESPAVLLAITASLLQTRSHSHPELEGEYIVFADEHRRYVDVTDSVCGLLGYSRPELLKMTIDDVTAPVMRSKTAPLFQQYLADGRLKGEYILLHRDGREIPIKYTATIFPDGCMAANWEPQEDQSRRHSGEQFNRLSA